MSNGRDKADHPVSDAGHVVGDASLTVKDSAASTAARDGAREPPQTSDATLPITVEPLRFVATPTFTANPNPAAPLVGLIGVTTNREASGTIEMSGGDEAWSLPLTQGLSHYQPVLGLKPDTEYTAVLTLSSGDLQQVSASVTWKTPPLPADFPQIELQVSEPEQMEAGMTLLDIRSHGYLVVLDSQGEVRWYYRAALQTDGHHLLSNGNLLFVSGRQELLEIDWSGNLQHAWYASDSPTAFTPSEGAIAVKVEDFHHTVAELPNGNILALSDEVREIENYPTSSDDPNAPTATTRVRGDIVIEFTQSGDIAQKVPLFDVLDPTRVGRDSVEGSIPEWSHCNAANYDASSDSYLVSCRHQDAVIKLDRESGNLVWILGTPANWRSPWTQFLLSSADPKLSWQYHQHAVEAVPGGVGLFDNGNYGAAAFEEPKAEVQSRAVRFTVDETNMTVVQDWSYGLSTAAGPVHIIAMGDADYLPKTGNTLITLGTLIPADAAVTGQLLEVTAQGTPVFQVTVSGSEPTIGASIFESDRIPDPRTLAGHSPQ